MSRPLPMIFHTSDLLFEDRVSAYKDILGLCKPAKVSEKIAKYVAQNVDESGWQAVWRSTPKSSGHHQPFDVLVEVRNVNAGSLTTEVQICEPLVTDSLSLLDVEKVNTYLLSHNSAVPLIELYPVYDESGQCDETALAVEHVRFFYENIWREWDEDEDGDYSYVGRYLETRLQLYHDIKDGHLPRDLVKRYRGNDNDDDFIRGKGLSSDAKIWVLGALFLETMTNVISFSYFGPFNFYKKRCYSKGFVILETYDQYRQKLAELKQLQEHMAAKDLDQELDEMDVLRCAQMSEFCESLAHSLQIIENPQMRYLLATVSPKMARQNPRGNRAEGEDSVTYIVAPKLQAGMVKFFQDNTVIEHVSCLGKALNSYYIGDTIVVFPGKYCLDGVFQLVDSVHITGKGNCSEIIVSCTDNDEFTLECSASDISIKNVSFEQEGHDNEGIFVIKGGRVTFDNCEFKCMTNGVTVESSGEMVMRECKLHGAKSTGITAFPGASVQLQNNKLFDNGEYSEDAHSQTPTGAILLEAMSDSKKTKAVLTDNYISNNHCYGICVKKDNKIFSDSNDPEYGIQLEMTNNVFEDNVSGDIGHFSVTTD